MPKSKRKAFVPVPFHESVVVQLVDITPRTKGAVAQIACLAALIRRTKCPPASCAEVKRALAGAIERLGGLPMKGTKKKLFTTADIAQVNGAYDTLKLQEQGNVLSISGAGHSGTDVRTGSGSGERAEEAPRAAVG